MIKLPQPLLASEIYGDDVSGFCAESVVSLLN